jgi:hypothetical protein
MKKTAIIKEERANIKRRADIQRKKLSYLSTFFDYSLYGGGYPMVAGRCENFEEYLELSARLPTDNELYSYDLHWYNERNDSLCIMHRVVYEPGIDLFYRFLVGDVERTLEKLTEGKCKIIERTIKQEETTVTALSCQS